MRYDDYMQVQWHLLCLEQTAERYKSFLDQMEFNQDNMRLWGVGYTWDAMDVGFIVDKRFPIPLSYIISGMKHALKEVETEIERIKKQAEETEVTL